VSSRPFVIAANWKMHKLRSEAMEYVADLATWIDDHLLTQPSSSLWRLRSPVWNRRSNSRRRLAFSHRICTLPIRCLYRRSEPCDASRHRCTGVILGHSERRQHFCETDEALSEKVQAALTFRLRPMLCVGEQLAQRTAAAPSLW